MVGRRTVGKSEYGATAVEYGLISGLIALGILGALVGTRTSLSGSLRADATAIAASVPGASASSAPAPVVVPYNSRWSTKTLSSVSTGTDASGAPVTILNYSDLTHVRYQAAFTKPDGTVVPEITRFTDDHALTNAQTMQSAYTDKNGVVHDPIYTSYSYNYPSYTYSKVISTVIGSDGVSRQTQSTYNSSGDLTGTQTGSGWSSAFQNQIDDQTYFNRYVASMPSAT